MSTIFRSAGADDADQIAALHADSWRRHYRGAYADAFLDGDVAADRRIVWRDRLTAPINTETILAEHDERLVGFIHVVIDDDPRWGSLVDNLHVVHDQHRTGIGTQLLARGAAAVTQRASGNAMYLWVLQQNTSAQRFYRARGATCVETATVPPPGADPSQRQSPLPAHGMERRRPAVVASRRRVMRPCAGGGCVSRAPLLGVAT